MTKIFDHLEAWATGNRQYLAGVLRVGTLEAQDFIQESSFHEVLEYEIKVTLGQSIYINPKSSFGGDVIEAKKHVVRRIKEQIYAELRDLTLDLEEALIAGDSEKAITCCQKIREEIFE